MNVPSKMIDDKRTITSIFRDEAVYAVRHNGVTSIVIYQENGQSPINYAAIYRGDILWTRIDLTGWGIRYESEKPNA